MSLDSVKTSTGQWKDMLGDKYGRPIVVEGGHVHIFAFTGAAAISVKTTVNNVFPGRPWKLKHVAATFSTAPTTSEAFTVTANPDPSIANRPSTVVFSVNPASTAATSILNIFEGNGLRFYPGDEVTVAFTNTDTRTVNGEVAVEAL